MRSLVNCQKFVMSIAKENEKKAFALTLCFDLVRGVIMDLAILLLWEHLPVNRN